MPTEKLGIEVFNVSDQDLVPGHQYLCMIRQTLHHVVLRAEATIHPNDFGYALAEFPGIMQLPAEHLVKGILIDPASKKTIAAFHSLHSSK